MHTTNMFDGIWQNVNHTVDHLNWNIVIQSSLLQLFTSDLQFIFGL